MDIKIIGAAIKGRRKELKLTQAELAEKVGLNKQYISGLERGVENPTTETLSKVASALDMNFSTEEHLALAPSGWGAVTTIEAIEISSDRGEISDGYHTFNELYHHRAVLFMIVCNTYHRRAWKSKLHHDGTMYDGMFIVGFETPTGQATYHFDIDPYWNTFLIEERDIAPEWDGHTSEEAIKRLAAFAVRCPY